MCGRFVLILEPGDFQDELDLGGMPESYLPRYNIAPTQPVAVVTDPTARRVEMLRWGLIPSWAKDESIGARMINARAETLAEKPSFRSALRSRRGLILASGFYEWRPAGTEANPKAKQPVYIHMRDGKPFLFAGLWETWRGTDGKELKTATIITTSSNALIAPFHDRMPVILDGPERWRWLDGRTEISTALGLLKPYPSERMDFYPVSSQVNSPAVDFAGCIAPLSG